MNEIQAITSRLDLNKIDEPPTASSNPSKGTAKGTAWYLGRAVVVLVKYSERILIIFYSRIQPIQEFLRSFQFVLKEIASEISVVAVALQPDFDADQEVVTNRPSYRPNRLKNYDSRLRKCKKTSDIAATRFFISNKAFREMNSFQPNFSACAKETTAPPPPPLPTTQLGAGIYGDTNSCYINSLLQSLRFVPRFRSLIKSNELKSNLFAQELSKIFRIIEGKKGVQPRALTAAEMKDFRKLAIAHGWKPEHETSQEDASAFCRFLFEKLGFADFRYETTVKPLRELQVPVRSFEVQGGNDTQIALPLNTMTSETDIATLSLKNQIIEELDKQQINNSLRTEELTEKVLHALESMQPIEEIPTLQTIKLHASDIPLILPLCMKRFEYNRETQQENKVKKKVLPSDVIDFPLVEDLTKSARYRLVSFVVHDGKRVNDGHYRTYVPANAKDKKETIQFYLEFNNQRSQVRFPSANLNEEIKENGYLYFYELVGVVNAAE